MSILPLSDIYEKIQNGSPWAGRTRDGLDVIIRVIVIRNEGYDYLKSSGQLRQGRTACSAIIILLPCLQSFSSKISFLAFSPKSEGRWYHACTATGRRIPSETSLKCYTFHVVLLRLKVKLKALTFIHNLNIAHRVSTLSVDFLVKILKFPYAVSRMHSMTILLSNGIQRHWAWWRFPSCALKFI